MLFSCAFLVPFLVSVFASLCFLRLCFTHEHSCVRKLLHRIDFSETPGASFGPVVCVCVFFFCFSGAVLVIFCCFSGAFLVLFAGTSFDPLLHCPAAWALLFPVLLLIRFCFFLAPCLAPVSFWCCWSRRMVFQQSSPQLFRFYGGVAIGVQQQEQATAVAAMRSETILRLESCL